MTSRLDFSEITPLGAYAAKQCPVRTQLDVLRPSEPAPPTPFSAFQFEAGNTFETSMVEELATDVPGGWIFISASADRAEREKLTAAAMERYVPVIVGGRLPTDEAGRRVGEPDLLVWAGDGYIPVDIKHHSTIREEEDAWVRASSLSEPFPAAAVGYQGSLRKHRGDALQLAHYTAMLATLGSGSTLPTGGIVGREGVVVWYDLTAPMWRTPAKSDGRREKIRTTLEVYDFEFGFRRDIAATALHHRHDPQVELLVEPMRSAECALCPWREQCGPVLEHGTGDASLLPRVRYPAWRALRNLGIRSRQDVLSLDYDTAVLVADKVDLPSWLTAARDASPETTIEELRPRAKAQARTLRGHGYATAGEICSLDDTTAQLRGVWTPEAVIGAHAALGPEPVYRRPGVSSVVVPRADIEIDIDMENSFDGVYLWGVLVDDRANTGLVQPGYRPFLTWDALTDETERAVFDDFWAWLSGVLESCRDVGASVRTYVWHEPAENAQLRRVTKSDPERRLAVDDLIQSDVWVDLLQVFRKQLTTGGSAGLKAIAPLAGFTWDVEDPGGPMSMVYHGLAVGDDPQIADTYRKWLVDYNRGDVMATAAIRRWMANTSFPALDLGQESAA